MKHHLIAVILVCSSFSWSQENKQHQIRSAIEISYEASFTQDSIIKLGKPGFSGRYDQNSKTVYNQNGDRIISVLTTPYELDDSTVFKYNDSHQLIQMEMYEVGDRRENLLLRKIYFYDKKGFNYLDSSFQEDGSFYNLSKSAYDYKKNIELTVLISNDGETISKRAHYYDNDGNLNMTIYSTVFSDKSDTTFFGINKETGEDFVLDISGKDTLWYEALIFDENDLTISQYLQEGGEYPYSQKRSFTYEFNEYGDWVRKLVFENGELTHVVERTLIYWED